MEAMKLVKFRITNYKSIKDSGWCWLASDLTVLAGKNESGKTALLEALRDFDIEIDEIGETANPLESNARPEITMCFKVTNALLDELADSTGIPFSKSVRAEFTKKGLSITKDREGNYWFSDDTHAVVSGLEEHLFAEHLAQIRKGVSTLKSIESFKELELDESQADKEEVVEATKRFVSVANTVLTALIAGEPKTRAADLIDSLSQSVEVLEGSEPADELMSALQEHLPSFVYFTDFSNILPYEIPLAQTATNPAVVDFAKVAELDLNWVLKTTDTQRRRNCLSQYSATITGDFMSYYGQDEVELHAEVDGNNLRLGIQKKGTQHLYKAEQRSKGFQWFLSFYLKLNAQSSEPDILLIDEPGLYLHARAQRDVLALLEKISERTQVIYSTHSPYLIDADRLDRIRLVIKDDIAGTRIENKIHKGADTETLTPIITAIGHDLAKEFSIAGQLNLVVEGITDYYYLQALRPHVADESAMAVKIIPCMGASQMPHLVSLLIGWDLQYALLFDNDKAGVAKAREIRKKLCVDENLILFAGENSDCCIEDLFSRKDFGKYVLEDSSHHTESLSNSQLLKKMKLDKALLAKKAFENMRNKDAPKPLSNDTKRNFKLLFEKIAKAFGLE